MGRKKRKEKEKRRWFVSSWVGLAKNDVHNILEFSSATTFTGYSKHFNVEWEYWEYGVNGPLTKRDGSDPDYMKKTDNQSENWNQVTVKIYFLWLWHVVFPFTMNLAVWWWGLSSLFLMSRDFTLCFHNESGTWRCSNHCSLWKQRVKSLDVKEERPWAPPPDS